MTGKKRLIWALYWSWTLFNLPLPLWADCGPCSGPYCSTGRDSGGGGTTKAEVFDQAGFVNSIGSDTGPSTGDVGGNLGNTGITKFLSQCDFDPCYTITEPGVYVLGEPIVIKDMDSCPSSCALTIAVSDVTVDLAGFSIVYGDAGTDDYLDGINGICISPGVANVTIKNGAIRKFTGAGINADTSSASSSIQQVVLADLMVDNNNIGVKFKGGSSQLIKRINITNSTMSANAKSGVELTYVETAKLVSSTASENINSGSNLFGTAFSSAADKIAYGVVMTSCSNVDLFEFDTEYNKSQTASTNAYGMRTIGCNKIFFTTCNSDYNVAGSGGASYGIALTSITSGVNTTNCILDKNNVEENGTGIFDDSGTSVGSPDNPTSTSAFTGNFAFNNSTANYNAILQTGPVVNLGDNPNFITKTVTSSDVQATDNIGKLWNIAMTSP
ncbi:MAG TPA: hypothetical protein VJJ83_03715 [Candidatus Babeliales bacterium]|nr:hypothetical protein [Candidatus Babeliales bacterium]